MKETLKHLRRVALSIRNGQGSHCSDFLLPSVLSAFLGFSSLFLVTYSTAASSIGWVRSVWGTANLHVSAKKKNHAMIFIIQLKTNFFQCPPAYDIYLVFL